MGLYQAWQMWWSWCLVAPPAHLAESAPSSSLAGSPLGEAARVKEGTACGQATLLLPLQVSLCRVLRRLRATGL